MDGLLHRWPDKRRSQYASGAEDKVMQKAGISCTGADDVVRIYKKRFDHNQQ